MSAGRALRRAAAAGLLAAAVLVLPGCTSVAYVSQAVGGHLDLLQRAQPVEDWLADPVTPQPLRERLLLAQRLRAFAVQELALPDNASYRRYADLGRDAVLWNVVAAPELSLELKTWCWPVVGCVGYRGYFDRAQAEARAAELRAEGWEVSVYGVPAYSTLGFSNLVGGDPLLNTFIRWPEAELARILFHEMAHQVVYVRDDTMFNESYATAVERIGGRLWLAREAQPAVQEQAAAIEARRRDFRALTQRTRAELQALYAGPGSADDKRAGKARIFAAMRAEAAALKAGPWRGFAGYDRWFAEANNAAFGVQAAYDGWVPAFEQLFEREGRDFARFHAAVQALARRPPDERRATLATLAAEAPPAR